MDARCESSAARVLQQRRDEIKHDDKTGRPYRANHAFPIQQGQQSLFVWIDIDEAPRHMMLRSFNLRREQMVGDGLQLSYDQDHWNARHQGEEPIQLDFDFNFDIELRKHAADAEDEMLDD